MRHFLSLVLLLGLINTGLSQARIHTVRLRYTPPSNVNGMTPVDVDFSFKLINSSGMISLDYDAKIHRVYKHFSNVGEALSYQYKGKEWANPPGIQSVVIKNPKVVVEITGPGGFREQRRLETRSGAGMNWYGNRALIVEFPKTEEQKKPENYYVKVIRVDEIIYDNTSTVEDYIVGQMRKDADRAKVEGLNREGDQAFAAGNYESALNKYRSALNIDKNNAYASEQVRKAEDKIKKQKEENLAKNQNSAVSSSKNDGKSTSLSSTSNNSGNYSSSSSGNQAGNSTTAGNNSNQSSARQQLTVTKSQDGKYYKKDENGGFKEISKQEYDNTRNAQGQQTQEQLDAEFYLKQQLNRAAYDAKIATQSAEDAALAQKIQAATDIVNAAAPLVAEWQANQEKKWEAQKAAYEMRQKINKENRYAFESMISSSTAYTGTGAGFQKVFIEQIPGLLESRSISWDILLGSPEYSEVFGKDMYYVQKNFDKPSGRWRSALPKTIRNGDVKILKTPKFLSPFYASAPELSYDIFYFVNTDFKVHNGKLIFDENQKVIGLKIDLKSDSWGWEHYISIQDYYKDILQKIGNRYLMADGNTFVLKDKVVQITFDNIYFYDLKAINNKALIEWPDSYNIALSASKEQIALTELGINFKSKPYFEMLQMPDVKLSANKYSNKDALKDKNFQKIETSDNGVIIGSVVPGSPAEKAGLKADDIITEMNGIDISSPYMLQLLLNGYRNDDEIQVIYERSGVEYNTSIATKVVKPVNNSPNKNKSTKKSKSKK